MTLLYLSGPYRAPTINGIYENIQRARVLAVELWKAGYAVLCPHLNTAFMDGDVPIEAIPDGDYEMVRRCDAVVMLPGWQTSVGATQERLIAIGNGTPVYEISLATFDDVLRQIEEGS